MVNSNCGVAVEGYEITLKLSKYAQGPSELYSHTVYGCLFLFWLHCDYHCKTLGVAISILLEEPSATAVESHGMMLLLVGHMEGGKVAVVEVVMEEVGVVMEEVEVVMEEVEVVMEEVEVVMEEVEVVMEEVVGVVGEDSGVEEVALTEEVVLIGSGMLCLYAVLTVIVSCCFSSPGKTVQENVIVPIELNQ